MMNSFYLINHPCIFQGEKKINDSKNYFEGWYFKNTNGRDTICFIPGIHIASGNRSAFIQIIVNEKSFFIPFSFEDFHFSQKPFSFQIGNNYFSEKEININIDHPLLFLKGTLHFAHSIPLQKKFFSPNIMGPFSFLPFMECNHAILSMKNTVEGTLETPNSTYTFNKGTGYIEKDWGSSFPQSYLWAQGNCFLKNTTSFFLSIAHIPIGPFSFQGFICVLNHKEKEYRFTTYNHSQLKQYNLSKEPYSISLRKNNLKLEIQIEKKSHLSLTAPKKGKMAHKIKESIDSSITLKLWEKNQLLFEDKSQNCGLEIVTKTEERKDLKS